MRWNEIYNVFKESEDFINLLNLDKEIKDDLKELLKFLIQIADKKIKDKYLICIKKSSPIMLGQIAFIPKSIKINAKSRNLLFVSCYREHLYIKTFLGNIYKIIYKDSQFILKRLRNMDTDINNVIISYGKTSLSYDVLIDDIENQYQVLTSGKKSRRKGNPKSKLLKSEINLEKPFENYSKSTLKFKGEILVNDIGTIKISNDLLELTDIKLLKIGTYIIGDAIVIKEVEDRCIFCNEETNSIHCGIYICENCYFQLYKQGIIDNEILSNNQAKKMYSIDEKNNLIVHMWVLEILEIDKNTHLEIYVFKGFIIITPLYKNQS